MTEEERGEAIIPEEDFREAISACCEDPQLKRYFTLAPSGAKLFIGLGFYSTHFGDKVDPRQYAECQAEIEPALTANDLKYLIRFEDDKNTKRYLRGLLEKREAEENNQEEQEAVPFAQDDDSIPVPRRTKQRTNRISAMQQWLGRDDSSGWFPRFCKIAAVIAIFPCIALLFYLGNGDKDETQTVAQQSGQTAARESQPTQQVERVAAVGQPTQRIEQITSISQPTQQIEQVASVPSTQHVEQVAAAAVPQDEQPVEQQTEEGALVQSGRVVKRRPKVVFTDGRKIVRRQGGRIEVPRVFSSIGAGVKPFWVYGRNPEIEAAKERRARAEWSNLCELAREGESRQ